MILFWIYEHLSTLFSYRERRVLASSLRLISPKFEIYRYGGVFRGSYGRAGVARECENRLVGR